MDEHCVPTPENRLSTLPCADGGFLVFMLLNCLAPPAPLASPKGVDDGTGQNLGARACAVYREVYLLWSDSTEWTDWVLHVREFAQECGSFALSIG